MRVALRAGAEGADGFGEDGDDFVAEGGVLGKDFGWQPVAEAFAAAESFLRRAAGNHQKLRVFLARVAPVALFDIRGDGIRARQLLRNKFGKLEASAQIQHITQPFSPPPSTFFFTPPSLSPSLFPLSGRKEISGLLAGAEFAVGAVAEPTSSELVEAVVQDFAEEKEMPLLAQ